jgi:hypothetical protein
LRYEDFVADPAASIRRILDLVGSSRSFPAIRAGDVEVGTQHTLGGNPVKFRTGPIRLRLDDEWQSKMDRRHRASVTALTWPMIAAYGYLGRGSRAEPATVAT